jgi:hypothetical protein
MADGKIPPVFQKGGNVSRSPMKDINQRAMELNRLRQVLEADPYEQMALLNDTQRQFIFIREMAVHLGIEGETLIQQVATYIDETLQVEDEPPRPEKVLSVVSSKLSELEGDAEKERQKNNARNGGNVPQPAVLAKKPWSRSRKVEQLVLMLMLLHQS